MRKLFLLVISLIMTITPVSAGEVHIDINDDVSLSPDDTFSLSASLDFPELQNYTEEIKKNIERDNLDDLTLDENTLNVVVKIKIPKGSLKHNKEWRSEGCDDLKVAPTFNADEIRFRVYKDIKSFSELEETLNQISSVKLYLDNISLQAPTKKQEKLEITGEVNIEYTSIARYEGKIEYNSFEEMDGKLGNYEGYSFQNVDDKWVLTYKNEYPIEIKATAENSSESEIGEQYSTRTIHVIKDGVEIKTIIQKSILKDYEVFFPAYSLEIDNEIYAFEEFRDKKQNIEETIELETSEESTEEVDEEQMVEEPTKETEETDEEGLENTSETKVEEIPIEEPSEETEEIPSEETDVSDEIEIEEYIIRQYTIEDKALFRKVLTPEETYQYAEGYSIEFNDDITYYAVFNEELLTSKEMEFESLDLTIQEVSQEELTEIEEEIIELPTVSQEPKYANIAELFVGMANSSEPIIEDTETPLNDEIESIIEEEVMEVFAAPSSNEIVEKKTEEKVEKPLVKEEKKPEIVQEPIQENVQVEVKEIVEEVMQESVQMIPVTPVAVETNKVEAPEIVYITQHQRVLPTQTKQARQVVDTNDTTKLELYLFLLVLNLGIGCCALWLRNKEF